MIEKILIIEDEKLNADRLKRLIKVVRPQVEVVSTLESVTESVIWLNSNPQPDLVMMDIKLSDGLSFEIFEQIKIDCPIIFTTAFDEYAVRAFKFNSIDYLLKPIDQDELQAAIERLENCQREYYSKSLDGLLNYLKPKEYRNRFLLPYRDGYKSVLVNEIAYFYSELKVTRAQLYNGNKEVIPQTLEELEGELNPKFFFRANRQFLIHIDAILHIHNFFNGKLKLVLKKNIDTEVIVSRDKANQLKDWMNF